jgi:hypothetical protein
MILMIASYRITAIPLLMDMAYADFKTRFTAAPPAVLQVISPVHVLPIKSAVNVFTRFVDKPLTLVRRSLFPPKGAAYLPAKMRFLRHPRAFGTVYIMPALRADSH